MEAQHAEIPGVTDDPVLRLIIEGRAQSLDDAEELYLDESIPQPKPLTRPTSRRKARVPNDELRRNGLHPQEFDLLSLVPDLRPANGFTSSRSPMSRSGAG
jgi:hypothetical protein